MPDPHGDPPPDECRFTATPRRSSAKLRLAALASSQFGVVGCDQIQAAGVNETTKRRWVAGGYLHRVLPRVYAVGHDAGSVESRLAAALLYAGPGAALSHRSAIWWWGLLDDPPPLIAISTPRRVNSVPGIRIHGRRELRRISRNGLAVTTASQALLDFAATASTTRLRFVLANADYHSLLDLEALDALTGRGVNGTAALREALEVHRPQLAYTRSEAERRLVEVCERHDLPVPRFNFHVNGWLVDAAWIEHGLVVEIDGYAAHRSRAQLERDHRRDLELRAAGYIVLRYTWRQLSETPELVAADLRRHLG